MVEDEADEEEEEPGKCDWLYDNGKPPPDSMLAMLGLSMKGGREEDGRAEEEKR